MLHLCREFATDSVWPIAVMPDPAEPFLHVFNGNSEMHLWHKNTPRNADFRQPATYLPCFLSARRHALSLAAFPLLSPLHELLFFSGLLS